MDHNMRAKIKAHLALSSRLEEVAKEVLKHHISVDQNVAKRYGLEYLTLYKKVKYIKDKEQFYEDKSKFDPAMKEIIKGRSTQTKVAKKYNILPRTLSREKERARAQGFINYKFDRKISPHRFTYLGEESLLNDLKKWERNKSGETCTCQLCALEELSTLAYKLAHSKNLVCTQVWALYNNRADNNWLKEFEMRHSDEISSSFKHYLSCSEKTKTDE